MSRSTSKVVSRAMFQKHRGEWIKFHANIHAGKELSRDAALKLLSEAWDRGIAQGRKMQQKGIED